eukprot:4635978-Alexandrium_andersonii.AAC.1
MWPLPPQPPRRGECRAADLAASNAAWKLTPANLCSHECTKGAPRAGSSRAQPGRRSRASRGRSRCAARPGATSSDRTNLLAASSVGLLAPRRRSDPPAQPARP